MCKPKEGGEVNELVESMKKEEVSKENVGVSKKQYGRFCNPYFEQEGGGSCYNGRVKGKGTLNVNCKRGSEIDGERNVGLIVKGERVSPLELETRSRGSIPITGTKTKGPIPILGKGPILSPEDKGPIFISEDKGDSSIPITGLKTKGDRNRTGLKTKGGRIKDLRIKSPRDVSVYEFYKLVLNGGRLGGGGLKDLKKVKLGVPRGKGGFSIKKALKGT